MLLLLRPRTVILVGQGRGGVESRNPLHEEKPVVVDPGSSICNYAMESGHPHDLSPECCR